MSGKIRLYGENSGYSELNAPDDAGDQSFTLPESGGDIVATNGTPQNGQAPVWNSSTNQWEPGSVASGGGGGIEEAPLDGQQYARKNAGWSVVESSGGGGGDGVSTKADIYGTAKVRGIVAGGFGTNLSGCTASSGTSAVGVNRITFNTPQTDTNYEVVLGGTAASSNVVCQLVAKTTTYFEVGIFRLTSPNVYSDDPIDFAVFDNTPAEIIVGSGTVTNTNIYGTAKAWGTVALGVGSGLVGCTTSPLVNGSSQVTFNTPMLTDDYQVVIAPIATVAGVSGYVTGKDVNGFVVANISNVNGNFTSDPIDFAVFDNEPAEVALTTFGDVINYSGPAAWGSVSAQGVLVNGMNIASTELVSVASYSVVFSTPMPDANYSVVIGCEDNTNGRQATLYETTKVGTFTKTANGFSYYTQDLAAPSNVPAAVNFAVFATNALPPKGGTGTDSWATVKAVSSNGPCTVPASFNTASVTRTAVGKYEVVFDTPMPSANYAVQVTCIDGGAKQASVDNLTPTGFTAQIFSSGGAATDKDFTFTVNATNAQLPNTVTQEQIESAINNPGLSAWGASDGDGNLLSGLNVSSITRTSGGNYTVNFQTPMPSVNYSAVASSEIAECKVKNLSTTSFDITTSGSSGNDGDSDFQFQVAATNALAPQAGVGADAWVVSDSGGSLKDGFNIASSTRSAIGTYDIVFTTPMPTVHYATNVTPTTGGERYAMATNKTTDGFTVKTVSRDGDVTDTGFSATVHASSTITPTYTWTRNGTTLEPANAGDTVEADCNTGGSGGTSGAGQIVGYQHGLWTATPSQGAIESADCSWSRIGKTVTLQANLKKFTDTSSSEVIEITGIPYTRDSMFVIGPARVSCLNFGEGSSPHVTLNTGDVVRVGKSTPSIGSAAAPTADYVYFNNFITASQQSNQIVFTLTYTTTDTTWTPNNGATIS